MANAFKPSRKKGFVVSMKEFLGNMETGVSESEDISFSSQEIEKPFDFGRFGISIKKSISESEFDNDDVGLESYLLAYEQLQNFFVMLGTAFQFVAMDVKTKIKILKSYQNEEIKNSHSLRNFSTVKSMINYEKEKNLLMISGYHSGSRTLLRLHRGLDFLRKFLSDLYSLENNVKLGIVARKAYDETLAEHHNWIVRNAARVAMQFLPTRIELLNKISDNNEETLSNILDTFPEVLEAMNVVYDRIQNIYSDNNLLNLP